MPSPFELSSAVERIDDNIYTAHVPDGWQQGRGAFGGLVLGILARAMVESEPDTARTLRMLSGEICGPVLVGDVRVEVSVLRRGKNLTNLDARLFSNGEVIARASAGLSTPRATAGEVRAPEAPIAPAWEDVSVAAVPRAFAPAFAQHFAFRPTGPLPFAGGPEPIVEGYVREAVAPSRVDAPMMIALLDSYWPAFFSTETSPRAAATVGFTAQLLVDPATLEPAVPLMYRARSVAMRDGFCVEMRELWSGKTLVGMNQQTFALLT